MSEEPQNSFHCCKQEDQIAKMNLLLLGNGNPSDGYIFKVMAMTEQMNSINEKLTGIGGIVKELHEESVGKKGSEKGKVRTKTENRERLRSIILIIMAVLTLTGLGLNAYFSWFNGNKVETTVKQEIRNQEGISKVTRGGYVKYNDQGLSDSVKVKK